MKPRRLTLVATAVLLTVFLAASWRSAAFAQGQLDRRADDGVEGIGSITWGACGDETLAEFGAECGVLSVPLDYSRPTGPKVKLALSRVRHTVPDDQYQGIMLVNPGGPGASGLIFAILGAFVPNGVGEAYDWIGFDPRGVGASRPSLHCNPIYSAGPRPPYDPVTRFIEAAWLSRVTTYADDCDRAGGRLLDHVKTIDSVRDMNAIRVALGASQLNYYGYSYGTYLGQVFATQYPTRVRRMVLDSNVDPRRVWYDANLDQDVSFEAVIQLFFDWVARYDDVYGLGRSRRAVEAKYYSALSTLAANARGELGAAEWTDAFLVAGYVQAAWPDVAAGFAAFVNDDDPGPALDLFHAVVDTTDDNGYAMYLATECTEGFWPSMWPVWRRDNTRIARAAPYLTWDNAWLNAPCAFWHAESSTPVDVRDHRIPPILLLAETLDPATPFSGSVEVRDRFQASSLIATEGGTTHANSLFGGNACVDDRVAAYLADGSIPKRVHGTGADLVCPATPEPVPVAAAAAARTRALTVDARQRLHATMFRR
ncbi:MAG TPA: alpha/beta hydrolase [Vicinamibacterales bacterium]|jgi:pimeloyl-ACP methyl ester carboxylesterase